MLHQQFNTLDRDRSSGMVLMLSIVFLLLITIIGMYLFRSSSLDLRMANNSASKALSFEGAETARISAEETLIALADDISAGTTVYNCTELGVGFFAATGEGLNCAEMADATAMAWTEADSVVDATNAHARYAFEYVGIDEVFEIGDDVEMGTGTLNSFEVYVFRITGHSMDSSGGNTTVQSIFLARKSS